MPSSPAARLFADTVPSPLGDLLVACTERALCLVSFAEDPARLAPELMRRFGSYELVDARDPLGACSRLMRYFAGDLAAIDALAVDPGGTPYQQRVWSALRTIPAGETRSYGALATQVGQTHARAVGHANAHNPIAIVVPCHRVIGADATLTGYAGGLHRKRWLLDHESTRVPLPLFA